MEQHQPQFRVECMDCHVVMKKGDPDAPISHGLCGACARIRHDEIDRMKKVRAPRKAGNK
jgi:hypothetical protein